MAVAPLQVMTISATFSAGTQRTARRIVDMKGFEAYGAESNSLSVVREYVRQDGARRMIDKRARADLGMGSLLLELLGHVPFPHSSHCSILCFQLDPMEL